MLNLSTLNLHRLRTEVRHLSYGSPARQDLHRMHCVYLVAMGHSCREVASWFGDGPRSVQRWVTAYVHKTDAPAVAGHAPLAGPSGRPSRVSPAAAQRLMLDLQGLPCQFGYPQGHWDGRLLQQHLQVRFCVALSLRQCQRLLHGATEDKGQKPGPG